VSSGSRTDPEARQLREVIIPSGNIGPIGTTSGADPNLEGVLMIVTARPGLFVKATAGTMLLGPEILTHEP